MTRSAQAAGAAALLALVLGAGPTGAAPRESAQDVAAEVDELLEDAWKDAGVRPSDPVDDARYLRRASLDVQGVVPDEETVRAFLGQKGDDRRIRLVRGMLYGQGYARTMAVRWANLLIGRRAVLDAGGDESPLATWLGQQLAANRPWDDVVRKLLAAEGTSDQNGAVQYFYRYRGRPEEVVGNAMRVFQGMQVQCAQCHDHPFNDTITQEDFWGSAAFFARVGQSYDEGITTVFEKENGQVRLPAPPGQPRPVIHPRFITGAAVDPGPGKHRREAFARLVTAPDNPYFAQATVNRVWSFFFGDGFAPPDDIGLSFPELPEVLERLTKDFRTSGYDMRRLCEVILSTRAYQLAAHGRERTKWDALPVFARARLRPLTPEQLWASLAQATGLHEWTGGGSEEEAERWRWNLERRFFRTFAGEDGELSLAQNTIPQALSLINGPLTNRVLRVDHNPVLGDLLDRSPAEQVNALFIRVLGRPAARSELRALRMRGMSSTEQAQFLQDIYWALLNSSEFVYNH